MAAFLVPSPVHFFVTPSHSNSVCSQSPRCSDRIQPQTSRPRRRPYHTSSVTITSCAALPNPTIKLMACDMDGTLLTTDKRVSTNNQSAISRLIDETDVVFVPATGKSRAGALKSMGSMLTSKLHNRHSNGCPGVYLQGLLVFDLNGDLVHEGSVSAELALECVRLSQELNIDLIAYSRDSILSEKQSEFTDLLPIYHEPPVTIIPSWQSIIEEKKKPLNKFIFMADPDRINMIRPLVAQRVSTHANLTQAQDNMLEVLPPAASKGDGVKRLLDALQIHPDNVLAIGDAENDVELLQMVHYSCVVANALPSAKAVAKYTDFRSNDDDGVADAIYRFLLSSTN